MNDPEDDERERQSAMRLKHMLDKAKKKSGDPDDFKIKKLTVVIDADDIVKINIQKSTTEAIEE